VPSAFACWARVDLSASRPFAAAAAFSCGLALGSKEWTATPGLEASAARMPFTRAAASGATPFAGVADIGGGKGRRVWPRAVWWRDEKRVGGCRASCSGVE
jgi:hypothetical protein